MSLFQGVILALGAAVAASPALAQSGASGSIQGRVLNTASGEYVRDAQVRIEGTDTVAVSEDGGYYHLADVPAGPVKLNVTYTGYLPATATVTVLPGQTATYDFELASSLASAAQGEPVKLSQFVVSGEREGNAKAIMQQRNSMDITESVSSDVYGDFAVDNAGEFLKHLPGVELDLVLGEVRTVRLNGLDSEYTNVTLDGATMASADANAGVATNARAFSFEQVSLSSMESIDVSYTVSADVDANSPAGTINFRSRHAYDRKGRRISVQTSLSAFSPTFNFDKSYGPDDRKLVKIRPNENITYSNSFLNNRLGISLNVSDTMSYSEYSALTTGYNQTPTATDPRPAVVSSLNFASDPRTNHKSTVNLTTDFKATPRLSVSLGLFYNYADLNNPQRAVAFSLGARNTIQGDGLLSVTTTSPTASVISTNSAATKQGQTLTALPSFEYRLGNLSVDGKFGASDSVSWYAPLRHLGRILKGGSQTLTGLNFTAQRSSELSTDWNIVQTAGPDISNGANYTNPAMATDDGRYAESQDYSGEVNVSVRTSKFLPVTWKAGVKRHLNIRDFKNDSESKIYSITGFGTTGAWADFRSPLEFNIGGTDNGAHLQSLSGGTIFVPDNVRMGAFFLEHPERFTQTMTATNFYNAYVANTRHYEETLDAAYLMATAKLGRLTARAGLRGEETRTDSLQFNPRTPAEMAAAGFKETAGQATTIDGIAYQYFSLPKIHRTGRYDSYFPSASLKYQILSNLYAQFGFSSTIRRPTYNQLTGVWLINDTSTPPTVTAPNPNLKPETSRNLSARLAYYFEPVGSLAINFRQNTVDNLLISNRLTAEEFGYTGPLDLSNYEFITTSQSDTTKVLRGMSVEYRESLSFLPQPFKGLGVSASYNRNYANLTLSGVVPHSVQAGLNYTFRRLSLYGNMSWKADYPTNTTPIYTPGSTFNRHRTDLDIGGGYRINERYALFFSARNITDAPYRRFTQSGAVARMTMFEQNHVNWLFGVKGEF
jgi:iron complex outermembrane recepter protein